MNPKVNPKNASVGSRRTPGREIEPPGARGAGGHGPGRGPIATDANRSELRQLVAGLSEGVILVEPDQRISWANDAALAMHGVAALSDLGATVDAYRARFSLRYRNNRAPGRYPIERVTDGETFRDVVVEVRHADRPGIDFVHSLRSLVVTDAGGRPTFLALIIKDISAQFEAEERFESAFAANPAPAVIVRLTDLRLVRVNTGFLEITGYARDKVLGRSVYEVDLLADAHGRERALEHLNAGEPIPHREAFLKRPGGGTHAVIVAGQPIEMGDVACMLFTFADLEPRRKAETALRQSEERFAKAFRLTPVPTVLTRASDHIVTGVNEAFVRVFGRAEGDTLGRTVAETGLWVDDAARERFEATLAHEGSALGVETCVRDGGGTALDCLVSAERVVINGEDAVLAVLQDITERKRSERELYSAIETVMTDASWFSRGLVEKLSVLRNPGEGARPATPDLTARERQVLDLICRGQSDKAIGQALVLSGSTVRNHAAALYRKIGVNRRTQAVVWGRDHGFPVT
ncbi:helix-turn-helix transcriptional regulator [Methylobacterium sp. WL2]|nr:helix-turn-helix transcriptional regulator [Methylobacterium sp. WL1]TXN57252.1 helix-turn-helix transcriptional regulator [Methylobacterium sp. WL2]